MADGLVCFTLSFFELITYHLIEFPIQIKSKHLQLHDNCDGNLTKLMWNECSFKMGLAKFACTSIRNGNIKSTASKAVFHRTYILIGHLPVGPFSVWHHLPHYNPVAPHVAGWCELPVCNRLWSRPADGNLPALRQNKRTFTRLHVDSKKSKREDVNSGRLNDFAHIEKL